jgi:hypothetical protein
VRSGPVLAEGRRKEEGKEKEVKEKGEKKIGK